MHILYCNYLSTCLFPSLNCETFKDGAYFFFNLCVPNSQPEQQLKCQKKKKKDYYLNFNFLTKNYKYIDIHSKSNIQATEKGKSSFLRAGSEGSMVYSDWVKRQTDQYPKRSHGHSGEF